ncbi:MAG: LLM class F420-dependent oxidoreductase [Acidimicrobiales bacterium]
MRIGLFLGSPPKLDELVAGVRSAHDNGFKAVWVAQIFGLDALTALAVAGSQVPDIELATGVVPTFPRHPGMLAGQALTVQAATGNRLTLGIGLSHRPVVEGMWGYPWDKPARHLREYLEALVPALRGENLAYRGETITSIGQIGVAGVTAPPVLVAALGEQTLRITGRLADGTVTWMVGLRTLADHTVPILTGAAEAAGRPAPRVAVGLPICVTNDVDAARARANKSFAIYGQLPSYRAMLDREGAANPGDVAILGDEDEVRAGVRAIADAGGTDFAASVFGSPEEQARTTALLAEIAAGR